MSIDQHGQGIECRVVVPSEPAKGPQPDTRLVLVGSPNRLIPREHHSPRKRANLAQRQSDPPLQHRQERYAATQDYRHGRHDELIDKSGGNKIVIDTQSKKIEIESSGDINITATGKINVDAKSEAKVTAPNISVQAQAKLELKAAQISIAGTAQVKISAPMVQIN